MKVKRNPEAIEKYLDDICKNIEGTIEDYTKYYAEYGWDKFTDTLANCSAQLYMMKTMIHNAGVMKEYRD